MATTRTRAPLAERFWAKVDLNDPLKCWPWTAAIDKTTGYGQLGRPGHQGEGKSPFKAHRVSYALAHGLDPATMGGVVRHLCHNRACVNPLHLALGGHAENLREAAEIGTAHWVTARRRGGQFQPRS